MLAIHGGRGAQGGLLRLDDFHGLSLIVDIRVGGNLYTARIEGFKHHNCGAS